MARGFKSKSGARVTVVAELQEEMRCDRGMLEHWEKRLDERAYAAARSELVDSIKVVERRIAELDAQHADAPKKVAEYRARIAKRQQMLTQETNRKQVKQLEKLTAKVKELMSDPETAKALQAMISGE